MGGEDVVGEVIGIRFLIVGGLYSITALLKTGAEDKVYSKHQELKQASKQASATTKTRVASRHGSSRQILRQEESVCAPKVRVRASVLLVLEMVLPAVPGPLFLYLWLCI